MLFAVHDLELPVRITPRKRMTDEELMRFSSTNEMLRVEQESNGDLLVRPIKGSEASRIAVKLMGQLGAWAEADGRGEFIGGDAGYRLADGSVRSPLLAWISKTRRETLTPEEFAGFVPLCPGFVVELCSVFDDLKDQREKMHIWLANGVELGWLIDPERRAVEIYRPFCEPEIIEDATSVSGEGPIACFVAELDKLWS